MPDVLSVDEEQPVELPQPPIQGRRATLQDVHQEHAGLRAVPGQSHAQLLGRAPLQGDGEELLALGAVVVRVGHGGVVGVGGLVVPVAVLFDALPVDAEAEDGGHLAQGSADLKGDGKRGIIVNCQLREEMISHLSETGRL